MQMRASMNQEEYEEQIMLMAAGTSTSPECLRLINLNKVKTQKLLKDRARENFFLANLSAKLGNIDSDINPLRDYLQPCKKFKSDPLVKNIYSASQTANINDRLKCIC